MNAWKKLWSPDAHLFYDTNIPTIKKSDEPHRTTGFMWLFLFCSLCYPITRGRSQCRSPGRCGGRQWANERLTFGPFFDAVRSATVQLASLAGWTTVVRHQAGMTFFYPFLSCLLGAVIFAQSLWGSSTEAIGSFLWATKLERAKILEPKGQGISTTEP
ncbi:hypothetical protein TW95_gp0881 [Pandoravirus inopinatum]|uniref:Uncharacterized protein n=1 Tax=Pandoravirus inopinatum TaxID=1605721 RepID=A0A0B5J720_9VIRU|nr:hypothetical protein TW95_gp0881 [Pandoravirus inopinatum]AJF97615.1 hypothetical protein [Pandoravirus inopinatum]